MNETAPSRTARWYYSPWFVLLAVSPFLFGPFGLPLVWKSPSFSNRSKWIITIVVVGYTAALIPLVVSAIHNGLAYYQTLSQTLLSF